MKNQLEWGIIGLGVMGTALARNLARNGVSLALYNQFVKGKEERIAARRCQEHTELSNSLAFENIKEFVTALRPKRKIIVMVPAGAAVNAVLTDLVKLLSPGDMIIDGGNSHFENTQSRYRDLKKQGISFLGIGVSGGETGALKGPAMMVGGNPSDFESVRAILEKIVAKNKNSTPCLGYFGTGGAGHFVKTIHNGIEYGEMQLLAEVYAWMRQQDASPWHLFAEWQHTDSQSYLLSVSADLMNYKSKNDLLIEAIEDVTQHKGTGVWSAISAAELGFPATIMTAALQARFSSAQKAIREKMAKTLSKSIQQSKVPDADTIKKAYDLARWVNHLQGFSILEYAKKQYEWTFSLGTAARSWTAGCIIQSELMYQCEELLEKYPNLLETKAFSKQFNVNLKALSKLLQWGMSTQVPLPAFSATWQYLMGITEARSTGNFIQAQRDYFGAHGLTWTQDESHRGAHGPWHKSSKQ